MARGKAPEGVCRICGKKGKLSFEHVPPKSAFNKGPIIESPFLDDPFDDPVDGKVVQGGVGDYTLCERCNNLTGKWYGDAFADWCYQGAKVLVMSDGHPKLIYLHYVNPLRVLKQIIIMAFSVNGERFCIRHPDLVAFVLNRDKRWLDPQYRVFVYFNSQGALRRVGDSSSLLRLSDPRRPIVVTEISHPPYGYVLTTDGTIPSDRLTAEITHFQRYEYDEGEVAPLYFPVLESHLPISLDYRTRKEIDEDARQADAYLAS